MTERAKGDHCTFEEWLATRTYHKCMGDVIGHDVTGSFSNRPGYEYAAGWLAIEPNGLFTVTLPQSEESFATLAAAEAYLWDEWCHAEASL